jgi:hypothetical protein
MAAQVRDPDGTIDENHGRREGGPGASRPDHLPNPIP